MTASGERKFFLLLPSLRHQESDLAHLLMNSMRSIQTVTYDMTHNCCICVKYHCSVLTADGQNAHQKYVNMVYNTNSRSVKF
jgi:hypothetical protein